MNKKKRKNPFLFLVNVLFVFSIAELSKLLLHSVIEVDPVLFTPIVFLIAKFSHDFYSYLVYDEKIFSYLEDYIREIILMLTISVAAGGIAFLAEVFLRGSVKITILAVIASLYLKKK